MAKRGAFIVIVGGEGSGKDTMIERCKALYPQVRYTREPGGSLFGEALRTVIFDNMRHADSKTLFGLFWAARADHMRMVVIPELDAGMHVISNRGDACTYAYQIAAQNARELIDLFNMTRSVFLAEYMPDRYVFLDVEPSTGMARTAARKGESTHFDRQKLDFHTRVREGYREFLRDKPHIVVDANKAEDEVWRGVLAAVQPLL